MAPPSSSNEKITGIVDEIKSQSHDHRQGSSKLLDELTELRHEDTHNGKLNKDEFKSDLEKVTNRLHEDGLLPRLDILEEKHGQAAMAKAASTKEVHYAGNMTIDLDGKGTSTGGDNQDQTSYADQRLSAWNTSYVALAPGWAADHGLQLGDIVAVSHDGKTRFAIYGDNYEGDQVHTEGSIHLARALNPGNGTDNTLDNVQFAAIPGSKELLHGSINQSDINRVGSELLGRS